MPQPLLRPLSLASILRAGGGAAALTGADAILAGAATGLGIDFKSDKRFASTGHYGDLRIASAAAPELNFSGPPFDKIKGSGLKFVRGPDGLWHYPLHNLIPNSEDLTGWTKNSVTAETSAETPPSGSAAVTAIQDNTGTAIHWTTVSIDGLIPGHPYRFGTVLKYGSVTHVIVGVYQNSTNYCVVGVNLQTGAITGTGASGSYTVSDAQITALGGGFYLVSGVFTFPATPRTFAIMHRTAEYTSGSPNESYTGSTSNRTHFAGAFLQMASSQVKYLRNPTGAALYSLAIHHDEALLPLGLPDEPTAVTNPILFASDLSNAAWMKIGVTAAQTATGPSGRANSATTVTATANNGTVSQAITAASAERLAGLLVKRRTGTGVIAMSQGEVTGSELVTNGTFDADISGWTATEAGSSSDPPTWNASGSMNLFYNNSTNYGYAHQTLTLTPGKVYKVSATVAGGGAVIKVGTSANGTQMANVAVAAGATANIVFMATQASCVLTLAGGSGGTGRTIDNVSVREVVETTLDVTGDWRYLGIPPATLANPNIVIRIATSGDAIDVAFVQAPLGASLTSPIQTGAAAVQRPADVYRLAQAAFPWNSGTGELQVDGIVTTPTTDGTDLLIKARSGETYVQTFRWLPTA